MGTLASHAEIGVWVQASGSASAGVGGYHPGKILRFYAKSCNLASFLAGKMIRSVVHNACLNTLTMGTPSSLEAYAVKISVKCFSTVNGFAVAIADTARKKNVSNCLHRVSNRLTTIILNSPIVPNSLAHFFVFQIDQIKNKDKNSKHAATTLHNKVYRTITRHL